MLFQEVEEEVWYHEGSPELKIARFWIAKYSLPRYVEVLSLNHPTFDFMMNMLY